MCRPAALDRGRCHEQMRRRPKALRRRLKMTGYSRPVAALFALLAISTPVAISTPATAQSDYPNRPIQLVVPYGPGGVADVGMRIMAEKLSARLKQQVVIENR